MNVADIDASDSVCKVFVLLTFEGKLTDSKMEVTHVEVAETNGTFD